MITRLLNEMYGIKAEEEMRIGNYAACRFNNQYYMLVPADHLQEDEILELDQIAAHLVNNGERYVSTFLKTKEGREFSNWEQAKYCVLVNQQLERRKGMKCGRKLAKFHYRGRSVSFPVKKLSRIGQWKQMWETRLDQMEKVWNEMLFQEPESDFDRLFLESFPYYMGICENAIQFLVDSEFDDEPTMNDSGTVCHGRFTSKTWSGAYYLKNPFEWVFDHSTRDLAEWTRERYFYNIKTYEPELKQFLKEYQSISPLSSFSWRLYYSRLFFPLHYFECVEAYYSSSSEQEKHMLEERLEKYLQQSVDHERFLAGFFELAEVPRKQWNIAVPEWLYV
ncbi:MAG: spore coat putative kinase YutH [Cytobacillus gottheilii]|uniref:spore coat putative kinase YutH n=1 Tax=Cytobacillus gottheilii TaxID=859144 RepID=UPI003464A569